MGRRISGWLNKREWLVIILALVVMLRIPSLFEPYWYGDEAIYLTLGQAINRGVPLYSGIHDNKPPLLYVVAAIAGGNQFWFKFVAMIWNLATIGIFVRLAEKVFENRKKQVVIATTVFAILTTVPLWEGNIANAELFFLLPTILAMNLLWKKQVKMSAVVAAGLALGIGALFKLPAALEAGIWPLMWLATGEKEAKRKIAVLAMAVLAPILVSGLYFAVRGSLWEYVNAAWAQNIPYLSSWQASSSGGGIYSIKGRAVIVVVMLAVLWGMARRNGRTATIAGMWGIITLFAAMLSGRPYPHYLMQMAGATAIATALMAEKRKTEKLVGAGVIALLLMSYATFKFYVYPITGYYANFVSWIWGTKTTQEYYGWFGPGVNANYEVVGIVKAGSSRSDKIFVWGDEPMVYALAGRLPVGKYTVKYHIKDYKAEKSVMAQLKSSPPKYVISYGHEEELPGLASWLSEYYALDREVGSVKIYKWTRLSFVISRL